ncbi:hypothetical protein ACFLSQ_09735 [Bacteroidota bacterium]
MQTLIRSILLTISLLLFFTAIDTSAQPPHKAMDRIKQMKKMKLLDILDLSEEEADKFIVRYNSWDKKIDKQKEKIDKLADELMEAVKGDTPKEELKKKSGILLNAQEKFFGLQVEKLHAMKAILDVKNYARFLIFEDRFPKELGKMMMRRGGGGGPGQGRGRR